jgi:hypothetical protein
MNATIHTISTHAFDNEAATVAHLLSQLGHMGALDAAIMKQASAWANTIRSELTLSCCAGAVRVRPVGLVAEPQMKRYQ